MNFADFNRHYLDQPNEVSIETQSLCNARCTFCPYPTLERIGNRMSDELLSKLMDEFATFQTPFYFSPFKVNEPLLDKRLIPLCEKFNEVAPKSAIRLFTNGSALTDKHISEIAGLKRIAHLWISLNEHEESAYERVMGLDFAITTKRLDSLHREVVAVRFRHPVVVSRVGLDDEFVAYVRDRWPRFKPAIIKKDAWIDYTEADRWEVPNSACVRWWELNVTSDGKVRHCCMDDGHTDQWTIGDLNKQTMLEVYNSPFWRERREQLLSRKALDERSPCARCTY